jgi:hypothetical protein
MARIVSISEKNELYAPDVPVCGGELFDAKFYLENREKFETFRSLFADEKSKEVYDDLISYKLSGNISYLRHADTEKEIALREILSGGTVERIFLDEDTMKLDISAIFFVYCAQRYLTGKGKRCIVAL